MNLTLDMVFGSIISYFLFSIIDWWAARNNVEVLKQGVYLDEQVDLVTDKARPEEHVNYRIWFIQVAVWCIIVSLSKIVVFFYEIANFKKVYRAGEWSLGSMGLFGNPQLELFVVMIVVPVTFNSIQFWIQDGYLKGDKHIDERIAKQESWF